jgi:hypothetical protein
MLRIIGILLLLCAIRLRRSGNAFHKYDGSEK